jgi:hypothetical protein
MKTLSGILILLIASHLGFSQKFLVPITYDPKIDDGKVAVIETDDIAIFVENLEVNKAALVFDLEIRNFSLYTFTVDPSDAQILNAYDEFPTSDVHGREMTLKFESSVPRNFALPENDVAERYETAMRSNKMMGGLFIALATGLAAFDAVKDAQNFNSLVWTDKMARNGWIRDVATMASFVGADIANNKLQEDSDRKKEDLNYLSQEILEITEVKPMEAVRGKVFFPNEGGKYFRIIMPVDGYDYIFDFRKAKSKDRKALVIPSSQTASTVF